jgi:hypothetical protein
MSVTYQFDSDIEEVYQTLTEPQFLVDRSLALGELSAECDVTEDGDVTAVNLVREVSRDLPRIMAKLFDPVQTMDMVEHWCEEGDSYKGDWTIEIRGQPVTITARFELTPTAGGCQYSVSHQVKAKIPLVGKQVEKYILGQTGDGARDELQYLKDYLS